MRALALTTISLTAVFFWTLTRAKGGLAQRCLVRFFSIWFPELRAFGSTREAIDNWQYHFKDELKSCLLFFCIPYLVLMWVVLKFTQSHVVGFVAVFLYVPLTAFVVLAAKRAEIRYVLRRDLHFAGVRLCPCGYNLRDNESGICPECGVTNEFRALPRTEPVS
ncbi:MAG: hypothetical protein H6819_08845 [Phycisphaerales bacterium]|nr:hypothetical protein [Phycisphaerales bacterium]MCB9855664.1 hypothetical protein [Phycisphaerales bacterium]MCB9862559.1 hypothetical protein [Phycisphaerales bacterium]